MNHEWATHAKTTIGAARKILEELNKILTETPASAGCHVFLSGKRAKTRADCWRRLKFTDGLASKFRENLTLSVLSQMPEPEQLALFSYDDVPSQSIAVLEKSEVPEISEWLNDVPEPDWPHVFEGDSDFSKNIRFQVTTLEGSGLQERIKIFKQKSNNTLLKKSGIFAVFNTSENEFKSAEGPVFDFSLDADFIEYKDFIFILKVVSFESLTNMRGITLGRAETALSLVQKIDGLAVDGFDQILSQLERRPQLARKLAAAKNHGTVAALNAESMALRIMEKKLPLSVENENGQVRILLDPDDVTQVREFVYLITDVYLRSSVTMLEYRTHSKEPA